MKSSSRDLPKLVSKLDTVFSKYIRLRDTMPNGMCKCISCGRLYPFSQIDAGHYIPRSNMATRFDERNANGECISCNRFSDSHLDGYRKNLISKIGENNVEEIESLAHGVRKFMRYEIEEMISHYQTEVVMMQKLKNV